MDFFVRVFFLILSISSATTLASPWAEGYTPGWVQDCEQAESMQYILKDYNKCNSKGYLGYQDTLQFFMTLQPNGRYVVHPEIQSVHVVVTDIKVDRDIPPTALCDDDMCFRALVFINGDSRTGQHVATWVTSPGTKWSDGSGGNYTPESMNVLESGKLPNQNSMGHFRLQNDSEMGLKGEVTGKVPGYFVMDHYVNGNNENMGWATFYHYGIGFHSSFTVNGRIASHGCTRLKYTEAKKMNFLARHVEQNFTVETRFTEIETLTDEERRGVSLLDMAAMNMEEYGRLTELAERGTPEQREAAQKRLRTKRMESGGLY